jgi:uncharacterized protein (TIGR03905 family)
MSKSITYFPVGVCSRQIEVTVSDDGVIEEVFFVGGCRGNTQGVAALAKGRKVEEVATILEGIDCNGKGTSCPDQLSRALRKL